MNRTKLMPLAIAWLAVMCGVSAAEDKCPAPELGEKSFRLASQADLTSLDPYSLDDPFTLGLLGNVYEGLVRRAPNGEVVPGQGGLAEEVLMIEPLRWQIRLRKNVKFQSGDEFNADDVIFSAKRVRAAGSDLKSRLPWDAKVLKVDDHTVDIVLSSPNPQLYLEWDTWYMMSKPWFERGSSAGARQLDPKLGFAALNANGTGAFSISEHKPGIRTKFKPNPNWWDKPHHQFDSVLFCTEADDAKRINALLSTGKGRVDWIDPVPPHNWQQVNSANTKGINADTIQVIFLGFDVTRAPFKDNKVRKAIYQAIDADDLRSRIMRNLATPVVSVVAPSVFAPITAIARWPYNVVDAKKLLADAGFPDGFDVDMVCPRGLYVSDEELCEEIVKMLDRIGITVRLNSVSKSEFYAKVLASGGYDAPIYLFGWMPGSFEAVNVLLNLVACRDAGTNRGRYNVGGFCNADVEAIIKQAEIETDPGKRDDLILRAFKAVHQDALYIPLQQQKLLWGVGQNLGVTLHQDARVVFDEFTKAP